MLLSNFKRSRSADISVTSVSEFIRQRYESDNRGVVYVAFDTSDDEVVVHVAVDDGNTRQLVRLDELTGLGETNVYSLPLPVLTGDFTGTPQIVSNIQVQNVSDYSSCSPVYFTWENISTEVKYTGDRSGISYPLLDQTVSYRVRASSHVCGAHSSWLEFQMTGYEPVDLNITNAHASVMNGTGCDTTKVIRGVLCNITVFAGTSGDSTVILVVNSIGDGTVTYGDVINTGGGNFTIEDVLVAENSALPNLEMSFTSRLASGTVHDDWDEIIELDTDGFVNMNMATTHLSAGVEGKPLFTFYYGLPIKYHINAVSTTGNVDTNGWKYRIRWAQSNDGQEIAPTSTSPLRDPNTEYEEIVGQVTSGNKFVACVEIVLPNCTAQSGMVNCVEHNIIPEPPEWTLDESNIDVDIDGSGSNDDQFAPDVPFSLIATGAIAVAGTQSTPHSDVEYVVELSDDLQALVLGAWVSDDEVVIDADAPLSLRSAIAQTHTITVTPRVKGDPAVTGTALPYVITTEQANMNYTLVIIANEAGTDPMDEAINKGGMLTYQGVELRDDMNVAMSGFRIHTRWTDLASADEASLTMPTIGNVWTDPTTSHEYQTIDHVDYPVVGTKVYVSYPLSPALNQPTGILIYRDLLGVTVVMYGMPSVTAGTNVGTIDAPTCQDAGLIVGDEIWVAANTDFTRQFTLSALLVGDDSSTSGIDIEVDLTLDTSITHVSGGVVEGDYHVLTGNQLITLQADTVGTKTYRYRVRATSNPTQKDPWVTQTIQVVTTCPNP